MFIRKKLDEFRPDPRFFFNVHLDGLEKTHDICVERERRLPRGRRRHQGRQGGRLPGLHQHDGLSRKPTWREIDELFAYLTQLGVDGFMLSPAYGYTAVNDREIFMTRDDIRAKFPRHEALSKAVSTELVARSTWSSSGQARADLHRLGQSDAQRQGLEGPVLPDHRRAPRDVRRADDTRRRGRTTATARTRAASTAWCTAATSRRRRWASTRSSATASRCSSGCCGRGMKPILVTGATGFIGWHVAQAAGGGAATRFAYWCAPGSGSSGAGRRRASRATCEITESLARAVEAAAGLSRRRRLPAVGEEIRSRSIRSNVDGTRNLLGRAASRGRARGLHQHGGMHRHSPTASATRTRRSAHGGDDGRL